MKQANKITFIGAGNMGAAIIEGVIKSKAALPSQVSAVDIDREKLGKLRNSFGIKVSTEPARAADDTDLLVLAVKPQVIDEALESIGDIGDKAVLSVAAGVPIDRIRNGFGGKAHVIRCMPNTPALIGEGVAALCAGPKVKTSEMKLALKILNSVGRTVVVKDEKLLDAVTGLSGSGPAYFFMVIEALADGGVLMGLDRATAVELAAQTAVGAAKMVLETKEHPGRLKDMVTSPAGTTAHAIEVLESCGIRGAFMEAVRAATERSEELGRG